jgi:hypothetical protein
VVRDFLYAPPAYGSRPAAEFVAEIFNNFTEITGKKARTVEAFAEIHAASF